MFYNIIPLIIIIAALVAVAVIVIRKFPALASIDISTISKVKETEVKEKILQDRLKRKMSFVIVELKKILAPLGSWLKENLAKLYKKTIELEKKYQREAKQATEEDKGDIEQRIKSLLNEAEELINKGDYIEAEKKYISAIGLDSKNIESYRGLANLYFKQKQFDQAEETLRFILRKTPKDDYIYVQLGQIAQEKDNNDLAFEYFQKAVDLEPNHPKNLDHLIEICIILGKRKTAKEAFEKLKEVNPENKKLEEFKEKIENIE